MTGKSCPFTPVNAVSNARVRGQRLERETERRTELFAVSGEVYCAIVWTITEVEPTAYSVAGAKSAAVGLSFMLLRVLFTAVTLVSPCKRASVPPSWQCVSENCDLGT